MQSLRFRESVQVEGRFIRQMSSRDQYGHIFLIIEPTDAPEFAFSWEVPSDQVPSEYSAAVFAGVTGLLEKAGLSCAETRVRAVRGTYDAGGSNPMAYTIAASFAFQDAIDKVGTISGT